MDIMVIYFQFAVANIILMIIHPLASLHTCLWLVFPMIVNCVRRELSKTTPGYKSVRIECLLFLELLSETN